MGHRILYFDPWTGVSGDMVLGALLDATRDRPELVTRLREAVAALGLRGVRLEVVQDHEQGFACTRVRVQEDQPQPLRTLEELTACLEAGSLPAGPKARALQALRHLVEVEAEIHGVPLEAIHLHEVGAADTLVDVLGTMLLVDALQVEAVYVGEIPLGGGTVEFAHGRAAVPAPATARLLQGYRVRGGPEAKELTTPTGALLLKELGAVQRELPAMRLSAVGYGAGQLRLESGPNLLRVLIGEEEVAESAWDGCLGGARKEQVVELVTNLDDITPEVIGHTANRLRESGVLEVWTVPAHMKKERPGVVLHALSLPERVEEAAGIIFRETGTLGIRTRVWTRYYLERGWQTVELPAGRVRVKWGRFGDEVVSLAPEYEDAARLAGESGVPLRQVMAEAWELARREQQGGSPGSGQGGHSRREKPGERPSE